MLSRPEGLRCGSEWLELWLAASGVLLALLGSSLLEAGVLIAAGGLLHRVALLGCTL